jgi:hypothetical protein
MTKSLTPNLLASNAEQGKSGDPKKIEGCLIRRISKNLNAEVEKIGDLERIDELQPSSYTQSLRKGAAKIDGEGKTEDSNRSQILTK